MKNTLDTLFSAVLLAAALFATAACAASTAPVEPGKGWRYRVFLQDLPGVDNLAFASDGTLYATFELSGGKGRVVRLQNGQNDVVVDGLNRPDGLLVKGRLLYVTEEVAEGRVLEVDLCSGEQRELERLHNPEGIDLLPEGDLVVSEDSVSGRLVRFLGNGAIEVIIGGLNRPEGIAVARDGTIYVAETGTGRVLSYRNGELDVVVDDLDEPDQVELAPDGALWITEDAQPGRLLRFKDGALETVLSGLMAPQGIAFGANGTVLVAEQGRGRILAVTEAGP